MIEHIYGDKIGVDVLDHLEDVLLFSSKAAPLVKTIRKVMQMLILAVRKCKATKWSLFTERIHYSGYIVTADIVKFDPINIDKIKQLPKLLKCL